MNTVYRIFLVTVLIGLLLIPSVAFSQVLKVRQARPDEIGMKAWYPIMDYNFEVKAGTSVIDYKGKSFYFCCPGCPIELKKNPEKYTAPGKD
jgi:YHS domain-containing protein